MIHYIRLFFVFCTLAATGWTQQTTYQDLPPGFDFPADEATLLRFRDTQNVAEMRRHAWYVFGGLTQPAAGGEAIWETWFTRDETFDPAASPQAVRTLTRDFTIPQQTLDTSGATTQAIGESLLSFLLFNKATRAHIRGNNLHSTETLTELNDQFDTQGTQPPDRHVVDFPKDAMSLKMVWWAVSATGLTPLPIWDFEPTNSNPDGNDFPTWRRAVGVDPTRDVIPAGETADLTHSDQSFPGSKVVSLNKLYHFELTTQAQVDAVNVGTATNVSLGRSATIGDYVALVMMHFTTKEIPDWVWGTLWWHDQPNAGPFGADRPSVVGNVWRNYLMDVAFSMDTPREFDGTPNSVYNPWLEAQFPNGMSSNCMTCHQRAVWPDQFFLPVTMGGLEPTDSFFAPVTQADFLWSVILESRPRP